MELVTTQPLSLGDLNELLLSDDELSELILDQIDFDSNDIMVAIGANGTVMDTMLPETCAASEQNEMVSDFRLSSSSPLNLGLEKSGVDNGLTKSDLLEITPDGRISFIMSPIKDTNALVKTPLRLDKELVPPLTPDHTRRVRKLRGKTISECESQIKVKERLRSYERRSRHKREHTMKTMRATVAAMETRLFELCESMKAAESLSFKIAELTMEATHLTSHNYCLRKALDTHRFFHSMLQLEYDHRESTPKSVAKELSALHSWRPLKESTCLGLMHDSFLDIKAFSTSADFVSTGLKLCGWQEWRKLVGKSVNFMFHKSFATDCSEELATRSWAMRAVQDQVSRYFGRSLEVQVEVLQRLKNDVVIVRRKIQHPVDGWVHHTIYLLFRKKTPDGHLVCIRDINPEATDDLCAFSGSTISLSQSVIWSKAFIWWKFTNLPKREDQSRNGFEVEYGGSLSSATSADAAFWMREVLILALRWENLVLGPILTLGDKE
ncbi:hypothetical protein CCR75_002631 [Bremia lactucae]|uniref:BZIP domain-containing protein n=1 Tax=Bremia lactucae TaxID=4779 RepID=A0A976IL08_BRELC|nr:hypothetical protein CCR75_002631 [Bremia lactucae]